MFIYLMFYCVCFIGGFLEINVSLIPYEWMYGWVCQYCNLERKRKFQQYKGMFIMSIVTLH